MELRALIRKRRMLVFLVMACVVLAVWSASCGGGGSSAKFLNTANTSGNNPVPTITSLSPASAKPGATPQTLTINGTNFISTSTVTYNGASHDATFISAAQLTIQLSAGDQATSGSYPVVVTNPAPGGGSSNAVNFSVTSNNPVPTITTLSPPSATVGGAAEILTINGTNFVATSTVAYNGVGHAATYISATQLTISLSASDLVSAGAYPVVVTNPAPGGGISNSVNFTVTTSNPVPTVTSLLPPSTTAGSAAQTLTINGSNFVPTATVTYNGVAHPPVFVSVTELQISLSVSDQATPGAYSVTVTNPAPGGGTSNSVNFTVTAVNPVPAITSLLPSAVLAGADAQTLIINGTSFVSTSTVTYKGVAHAATYVSATQLQIALSASDQATAGTFPVVVNNPAPGGGSSSPVNFTVDNPLPIMSSLSPTSAAVGTGSQTLTVTGTNFLAVSTVTYNGVTHAATYLNATQLTISLNGSDLATAGNYPVIVTNPGPGGGASNSENFAVTNLVPTISSLSPNSATVGAAAQTLTINGTNFLPTSTATFNGAGHATKFVNSTQLTVQLSTTDLATNGTYPVVVTNPAPGGGASNSVNFSVNNSVPAITSLSPVSTTVGTAAQTLTINGTNFLSTSTVTYNGLAHTPAYVNSGELTIQLTASDQASTGNYAVVVTNPAPGGGASNSVNFVVNNPLPVISDLSPASSMAAAAAQAVTINGTNFLSTSTVTYNGAVHAATFVSSTQLTIQLNTADQAAAGIYGVVVTNPTPGGGSSNSANFTVDNPSPTISSLSPALAAPGTAAQTLTITGTQFLTTSSVTFNGVAHTATFISATQLIIQLSASDQSAAGMYPVVVTNPAPGGGASNSVNFAVDNPVPAIASLSPASASPGAAAQTLTINGSNFLTTSTVTYNGVGHLATFVTSGQLTIQLSASDQATAGAYTVVVTNPAPGGGASNAVNFSVAANNPIPTITSLSPASTTVGTAPQTLTINGTNFLSSSTVTYNGIAHTATYVNSGQLTILLSAGDQATVGSYAVVMTNPAPGGGASNSVSFAVNNPGPAISSVSPASAKVGTAAQTLTINGANFLSGSTVTYNGVGHTATYVSATQLTIQLSASDQSVAGSYPVLVTNPAPGGGVSNAVNFAVNNLVPNVSSLSPASSTLGTAAQTLTINGTNFLGASSVTYNGVGHAATYVSATQLTIQLSAGDQATAGSYAVVVTNPAPGGGASNAVNFTVNNPLPTISSLAPASVTEGATAQTLTINGTNFLSTSTVTYNGVLHTATLVNSTQLTIPLSASDQATAGTDAVVVTNPTPGGGASNAVNFTVNNPVPTISTLSPASAIAGAAAQTLTINGTNFVITSAVTYNGVGHAATFVNPTQLTILLSASDQATAGTYGVIVTNPAPGGGASNSVNFSVTANNPVPAISSLSPAAATVGAAAQVLTINGSNFISASTVTYNSVAHTATYVNSSQLTTVLSVSDQATAGSYAVVVTNPAPGGGTSNALNFAVNNPVPAITSLSPASGNAGAAAQTLTINGSNFLPTSTVTYNGVGHTATYLSSGQLTIQLSASDQATTGTYAVVVTNPAPGGGASNTVNFTVTNPLPVISSLSPASATAGTAAQTLTINGTNFVSGATVTYNAVGHAATFVNSTQLTIQLSASDQATGGTYAVVVTNPAPGGGASNSFNFTVNYPVPSITSLSPTPVLAGAAAQTLTINGTNFFQASTVTYNAVAHAATYVNSTQLTIQLSASDQATGGTYPLVVTNPTPGGGASNSFNFTVNNLVPAITSLSPTSILVGAGAQTLYIFGTNFVSTSTVTYNGVVHTATFVSSVELSIQLSASDQVTTGTYAVVVTNPSPGGGTSNSESATVIHYIQLSWTASSTPGVTYNVYRGTTAGQESTTPLTTCVFTGATSCADEDPSLVAGTTYYYVVTAVLGTLQSAASNEAHTTAQ